MFDEAVLVCVACRSVNMAAGEACVAGQLAALFAPCPGRELIHYGFSKIVSVFLAIRGTYTPSRLTV